MKRLIAFRLILLFLIPLLAASLGFLDSTAQGSQLVDGLVYKWLDSSQVSAGLEPVAWSRISEQYAAAFPNLKKLTAGDAQSEDFFGWAVAASGNTVVIGAFEEDGGPGDPLLNFGGAYVFERNLGGIDNWGQSTKLVPGDPQAGDFFGYSVAISGDTIVVGSFSEDGGAGSLLPGAGAAYVFERNLGGLENWGQAAKLTASDAEKHDAFGSWVSISGDTVVVGAPSEAGGPGSPVPGAGAAYVFERNLGGVDNWGEAAKLMASDAQSNDTFGEPVSISGNTIVAGARFESGAAGAAYVFERNLGGPDNWGETVKLTASDAQAWDRYGASTAIYGNNIVIGAPTEDGGSGDPILGSGALYVYERNLGGANKWGEAAKITAGDAQENDEFGFSVTIEKDSIISGAIKEDGGPGNPRSNAGSVYVFKRDLGGSDNWGQADQLAANDSQADDLFGISVAQSGTTLIVGAYEEDGGSGDPLPDAGAAYIFYNQLDTIYLPLVIR